MPRVARRPRRRSAMGSAKRAGRALGYGRRRHNTIKQSKRVTRSMQHTGIFAPETYTTLATVDSGQDRLWVLGTFGGVEDKISFNPTPGIGNSDNNNGNNPGSWKIIDMMNSKGIARHKCCPMGVYRLNCLRDFVHSRPTGWDARCGPTTADVGTPPAHLFLGVPFTDEVAQGFINGQKTYDVVDAKHDEIGGIEGYFKPTAMCIDQAVLTAQAGPNIYPRGPMYAGAGLVPQGYTKLASVYARNLVMSCNVTFSLINVGAIATQKNYETTVGQRSYGNMMGSAAYQDSRNMVPNWNDLAQSNPEVTLPDGGQNGWAPDGPVRLGRGEWSDPTSKYREVPVGDGGIYDNITPGYVIGSTPSPVGANPSEIVAKYLTVDGKDMMITPNQPRAFGDFAIRGRVDGNNTGSLNQTIHITGIPNRCPPKYIWFGVTIRKNYVGGNENNTVVAQGYNNAEYPSSIPINIDEASLDEGTKLVLVNISENAQAATIELKVDIAKWLGVPSLQDSLHGYYTAKPGPQNIQTVLSLNSRQLYPLQGLYAIPWIAPIIHHYGLAKQAIGGACPYLNRGSVAAERLLVDGTAIAANFQHEKMGAANAEQLSAPHPNSGAGYNVVDVALKYSTQSKQVRQFGFETKPVSCTEITGYSNFFCLHSKITWQSKFYSQRVMELQTAPAAWGGGATTTVGGQETNPIGFGTTWLDQKYI